MLRRVAGASVLAALVVLGGANAATDRPLQSFPAASLASLDAGTDLLFVVGGDNRPTTQSGPLPRVLGTILSEAGLIRPDFVIWTGDTVYGYCDTREELEGEYRAFAAAARYSPSSSSRVSQ
jgi:hypothetical protein